MTTVTCRCVCTACVEGREPSKEDNHHGRVVRVGGEREEAADARLGALGQ